MQNNHSNDNVQRYNDDLGEAYYKALTGAGDWPWQTSRVTMGDLMDAVRATPENVSYEAANDNEPVQLDLFAS